MSKCTFSVPVAIFALAVASVGPVSADTVGTADGSVLKGEILRLSDGKLVIKTSFAGEVEIPWDQVTNVETESVMPIHLGDGSVIQGRVQPSEAGMQVVWQGGDVKIPVTVESIAAVNPPPPPTPTPVKWEGKIVGSMSITDGNTETEAYSIAGDLTRRAEQDRINLRGGYFHAEDEDDVIRSDRFIAGKYDYFFTKRIFGYLNARLDRDDERELDLRTTMGAGLGYQFLEDDVYNLFGELGGSYVDENWADDTADESYVAARAAYHFDWWMIREKLQFYQDVELLVSVEDTEDWFANTITGLTWKWTERWAADASVRFEYDNTPAPGQDEGDVVYNVGIAYTF